VFSWTQSRVNLTSWYGVGSTLKFIQEEYPEKFTLLKQQLKTNSFLRYILTNVDSGLAATDAGIIELYASLVTDEKTRNNIMDLILSEYRLTTDLLSELLEKPFQERRTNHFYSTRLRAVALNLMHQIQVKVLREWRTIKDVSESTVSDQQNITLLKTINAVANALGSTG
jgi:phosphoenolpyruvate carboxylase